MTTVTNTETMDEIAERITNDRLNDGTTSGGDLCDAIVEALRNERERALRDAARLECVFCAGAEGFNPLPVEVENGNYVHRNEPPNGQAGVYCTAPRINALKGGNK